MGSSRRRPRDRAAWPAAPAAQPSQGPLRRPQPAIAKRQTKELEDPKATYEHIDADEVITRFLGSVNMEATASHFWTPSINDGTRFRKDNAISYGTESMHAPSHQISDLEDPSQPIGDVSYANPPFF